MPTPAQIRLAALRVAEPWFQERRRLDAVLTARIASPRLSAEERRLVVAKARAAVCVETVEDTEREREVIR